VPRWATLGLTWSVVVEAEAGAASTPAANRVRAVRFMGKR
jgi:hypothetical protein